MDNKRPPANNKKPFDQPNQPYRKETERPYGNREFQPRDNNAAQRNDRFQPRSDSFQPRDNRFQPRNDRFQPRDNRFQTRDEKSPPDDKRFQPRAAKFQPKTGKPFQPKGKFQPKGRYAPKGGAARFKEPEKLIKIVSEMQITDGKLRGKYLKTTASPTVRPTARRIREVMFRILFRRIRAGRFLDLCAGSGMVGIEAISRGAIIATFVERSAKMCSFIKKNLESTGIKTGHGEVVEMEAAPFLKRMAKRRRQWDVVYYDPPYDSDYEEVLGYFAKGAAIRPKGTLVIEHHAEMFFPETFGVMHRWRVLVQGETALSFYERR